MAPLGFYLLLLVLQTCDLQDQTTKHQTLSRSSSEPGQLTLHSTHTPDHTAAGDQWHTGRSSPEHDRADAHTHTCHDKQIQTRLPDEVKHKIDDKILVKSVENRSTSENKRLGTTEVVERQTASTDTVRCVGVDFRLFIFSALLFS